MELPIPQEILIVLALVLLNGVFSGAEIAVLSLRRTRVDELIEEGSARARAVRALRDDPERFLATVQVGITLVGTAAAAFGGSSLADHLAPYLAPVFGQHAPDVTFALVVVGVAALSIVLGELVPKSLALRAGETYALFMGPILLFVATVARPVVWTLTAASNVVLRLFGDRTSFTEGRLSRDEIRQLVDEAATAGTVDKEVGEIATRALDFSDLDVASVMIPRPSIVAVPIDLPVRELADVALTSGHARVVVHGDDLDDVRGFVNVREVLARLARDPSFALADALHPVSFAPETMSAPAVLRDLQRRRAPLAIVLNELGIIVGLVTVEDLVEELVGEILSENDRETPGLELDANGSAVVDGGMPLHELERAFDVTLPEQEAVSTVAGLCLSLADRIPLAGETFEVPGVRLEVVEATARRVKTVRVTRLAEPAEAL